MSTIERVRLTELGWDADLTVEHEAGPPPEPTGDEVQVRVEACGVCFRDLIDRSGRFPFIMLPITPGHEAVGRVTAVGPAAEQWRVGDRVATMQRDFCGQCGVCLAGDTSLCEAAAHVFGLTADGGYSSHLTASERCFFEVPEHIPAAQAAILNCTYGTAYRGLKRWAGVEAGQHVLITGANGGVGSAAVQVARRLGATVTAIVRDEVHRDYLVGLGANEVIVDPGDGFHKRLPGGLADAALECVGPPTFNSSLRSVRTGGCIVVIGNVVQEKVAVNLGYLVTRGLRLVGSSGATRADMAEVIAMHAAEPFAIQIHSEVKLAEADRAQRLVRAGGLEGRVVVVPEQA